MKLIRACFRSQTPVEEPLDAPGDTAAILDPLLWSFALGKHLLGRFSCAAVRARYFVEDYSQVETDPLFTFIGLYDGHYGPQASRSMYKNLYDFFCYNRRGSQVTIEGLEAAIRETEAEFLKTVDRLKFLHPLIQASGSCCLFGVLQTGTLHIVNLGDSRAVLGVATEDGQVIPQALSKDHSVSNPEVREEIQRSHPEDKNVVVEKDGTWHIKGLVQVTRSIGDFYMKKEGYALDRKVPAQRKFCFDRHVNLPLLSAEPALTSIVLQPEHRFVVFASDNLWKYLSEEQVCEIVHTHSSKQTGVAESLLRTALREAARRRSVTYDYVKACKVEERGSFHDDITVIVVYIDRLLPLYDPDMAQLSIRAFPPQQPITSTSSLNVASTSDVARTTNVTRTSRFDITESIVEAIRASNVASTSGTKDDNEPIHVVGTLTVTTTSNVPRTRRTNIASRTSDVAAGTSNGASRSESDVAGTPNVTSSSNVTSTSDQPNVEIESTPNVESTFNEGSTSDQPNVEIGSTLDVENTSNVASTSEPNVTSASEAEDSPGASARMSPDAGREREGGIFFLGDNDFD